MTELVIDRFPPGSRILVAPLDWGLGHAARCIPLIRRWKDQGHRVTLAASGSTAALLRLHFPDLEMLHLRGYGIRYSRIFPASTAILFQLPRFFLSIGREHRWLKKLLRNRRFDAVVSDNRYGLWSGKCQSIILTHQLFPVLPRWCSLLRGTVIRRLTKMTGRFDECWIPDREGDENLSGILSHRKNMPANTSYIGWLSRLEGTTTLDTDFEKYDCLMLVSGPEPSRSLWEKQLIGEALDSGKKTLLVQGLPDQNLRRHEGNLTVISKVDDQELLHALQHSKRIVCRSGYSTLMDLMTVGRTAELVPTPGQTEQEYLAERMRKKFGWG
ncbi:MAG: hypothetical protein RL213_505 [Bacteroidota bacterium]|jgi:hypothetical protein